MAIIPELLAPSVVTGMYSRIYTANNPLCRYFGMGIGGANVNQVPGRSYSWDIMDDVRTIAAGRAPGTGPAVVAKTPVARQTNTFPRSYEKTPLDYETLNNIRTLGQNAGVRDRLGLTYVEGQMKQQKLRQENFREFMVAALVSQGTFDMVISGDDWTPALSGGTFTIDYLIPAANKTQLNMLGAGNIIGATWATAGTDIPAHLDNISIAFQQLVGLPLALVITDSTVWNAVLNNTKLQAQGGSVNAVFAEYGVSQEFKTPDGKILNVFVARLRARPHIQWLIVDTGLTVNGTYTRWFGGTKATFLVDQDALELKMQEGSEPVKTSPMAPAVEQFGFTSWVREWDEPARMELHSLQNCIPQLIRPLGVAIGTVIF